ncbi:MAG: hypothetical protein B9S33_09905 [Pedosphaera sp. Tous-C6FEB]|nr:MAG: hypothetical protein B9S33_09905 [Pedosphaera sp. Tous-C6FEB]
MNLAATPQFEVGQLVAAAVGSLLLGALLAGLLAAGLHAALHAAGALRTQRVPKQKFSWWLAVLAVGLGVVVGGWTGLKIGVARAAVPVARDLGPKMVEEGLQQALRGAGLTNFAQLDVKRLRELVAQAESAQLPPLEFPGAEQVRPQIEEARAKLLPAAKALLDAHAKDGKLALREVVTSLWPKLFDELAAWERRFRRWEIITGILWVVGIEAAVALGCLLVRLTAKVPPARPPTLPKL